MRADQVRTRSGSGISQPLDPDLRVSPGRVKGQWGPGPDIGKTVVVGTYLRIDMIAASAAQSQVTGPTTNQLLVAPDLGIALYVKANSASYMPREATAFFFIAYVAKYASKAETSSTFYKTILRNAISKLDSSTRAGVAFQKIVSFDSLIPPLSKVFVSFLESPLPTLTFETSTVEKFSILDHYLNLSLLEFATCWEWNGNYRRRNRLPYVVNVWPLVPPDVSTPDTYERYCYARLLLNHPFHKLEELLGPFESFAEAYTHTCIDENHHHIDPLPTSVAEQPEAESDSESIHGEEDDDGVTRCCSSILLYTSVFDTTKQSSAEETRPSSRLSIVSLHDPVFVPIPSSPTLSEVKFMSTLASDTTRPSVSIITLNTSLFKHDSLSKDQNHFSSWKRQFIQTLRMNQGADGYLDGRILCPSAETEPRAYSNWNANNGSILGFMGLVVDDAEQEIIEGAKTAEAAWNLLVQRHAQEGPVKQVQLIQEALNIRYSSSEKYSTTSSKLTTLNKRIWDMGSLNSELFLCIIMINSMSNVPELRATRENVAQQFAQSDGTNPDLTKNPTARKYDSSDVKRALDMAQGLVDSDSKTADIALSARTPQKSTFRRPKCSNPTCPKPIGHTKDYCISPGGGMAEMLV
ncbi:hypothetical protein K435DRAFT_811417 [Dendrothele bispora CBS 962.96]|uniref:Retrotransposon Copia-like N-terminal domain-containing protein n=1 Tax=Dendrothele bispora (strain CBS 962.96) TaxID=1314807 RepID=A0A4S8KS18_DENBC|nr:hypothetical protein K435DRAFT_811417 [Dendrothele bispora CBS 962.96]